MRNTKQALQLTAAVRRQRLHPSWSDRDGRSFYDLSVFIAEHKKFIQKDSVIKGTILKAVQALVIIHPDNRFHLFGLK